MNAEELEALTISHYADRAGLTAIYPEIAAILDGNPRTTVDLSIVYPALGLVGEAGEVAEQIKKLIRDDSGMLTPERRTKIIAELGDVLWYINALAAEIGSTLEEIADVNMEKLARRQAENKLKGSGSNR